MRTEVGRFIEQLKEKAVAAEGKDILLDPEFCNLALQVIGASAFGRNFE